jgi:hypothetical protein
MGVGVGHVHPVQGRDRVDGHVAGDQGPARLRPDQALGGQAVGDGRWHDRRRHHHPDVVVALQQRPQRRCVEVVEVLVGGQDELGADQVVHLDRRREPPGGVVGQERVDGQARGRRPQQEAGLPDPGQQDGQSASSRVR